MKIKPPVIAIAVILIILQLSGCRSKKEPVTPPKPLPSPFQGVFDARELELRKGINGGTFRRADLEHVDTFNPITTRSKAVYSFSQLIYESLFKIDPFTGFPIPWLVKNYRITNDGFSILMELDRNKRFSDGSPLTARDVLFSFQEIYLNPELNSKKPDALKLRNKIIQIEMIDTYTIKINLPVPFRPIFSTLAEFPIFPQHILGPILSRKGIEWFNSEFGNVNTELKEIVGSGPYMIDEYKKSEYISLKPNPYYIEPNPTQSESSNSDSKNPEEIKIPYLEKIIFYIGVDRDTQRLKFQIGELDFYDISEEDISSGDIKTLIQNEKEGGYTIYTAGYTLNGNHFLVLNQNPNSIKGEKLRIFRDVRFRKALSMLIDRNKLIDEVFKGYGYADLSPERSPSPYHIKITPVGYHPEEARTLLHEIGLKDSDGDGFLNLPSGENFTFTILTNKDNPFRMKMANLISRKLRENGLNVDYEGIDYDLLVTKLLDTFEWEAVIIGIEGTVEPNNYSPVWESRGSLHLWYPYQESPSTEWEQRLDEIFALGRTTFNTGEALKYYREYQKIVAEYLPVINLVIPARLYGFRDDFSNIIPSGVSYNEIGLIPYIFKKISTKIDKK